MPITSTLPSQARWTFNMRVRVRASVREKRKRRLPSSSSLMMIGLLILGLCKQGIYKHYKGQTGCLSSGLIRRGKTIDKRQCNVADRGCRKDTPHGSPQRSCKRLANAFCKCCNKRSKTCVLHPVYMLGTFQSSRAKNFFCKKLFLLIP